MQMFPRFGAIHRLQAVFADCFQGVFTFGMAMQRHKFLHLLDFRQGQKFWDLMMCSPQHVFVPKWGMIEQNIRQ